MAIGNKLGTGSESGESNYIGRNRRNSAHSTLDHLAQEEANFGLKVTRMESNNTAQANYLDESTRMIIERNIANGKKQVSTGSGTGDNDSPAVILSKTHIGGVSFEKRNNQRPTTQQQQYRNRNNLMSNEASSNFGNLVEQRKKLTSG